MASSWDPHMPLGDMPGKMNMSMSMPMYFTNSYKTTLWFKGWSTSTRQDYYVMLFVVFAMGFVMEALLSVREHLSVRRGHFYEELGDLSPEKRRRVGALLKISSAFLYFVSLVMGYLLMLAAMTYNTGIFFAVVLGMTFGFYCLRDDAAGPESQGAGRSYDMANHCGAGG